MTGRARTPDPGRRYREIYAVVRKVPKGRVTTYGRVAALLEGVTPRMVGYAMAAAPEGARIPWHRVLNHEGRVSLRAAGDGSHVQRALLEREGVVFDEHDRVDLARVGWPPSS